MTPRENLSLLVSGGNPRWIPFTMDIGGSEGFTSAIQRRFETETGAMDPAEYFDYDLRLASVGKHFGGPDPRAWHPEVPEGTTFDEWGIGHWAGGAEDTYEHMYPPFAAVADAAQVAEYPEPVLDSSGVRERVRAFHERGYPVVGYAGSIYEWSWWLRGMEQFMVDLLESPELAAAIVKKVSGFTTRLALESAAAGIDVLAFYDDAGSQWGMQVSPSLWRGLIKPAWKSVLDAVRARFPGAVFFLHSCGAITEIVPDIVELGFHILHPIQPECMDAAGVKNRWGSRIVACATLGAQHTLSMASPEEVRAETERLMDSLGADRRCLICPSNRVQPETPWENLLAFSSAARSHRFGRRTRELDA
ncbi:MAG TPA: uroporphyrinogen decarboxylase family protein [Spirochaetia bacterium]|nr:uroporphyrinogen decarboxylase family protein [Spirochaetia bacterium]